MIDRNGRFNSVSRNNNKLCNLSALTFSLIVTILVAGCASEPAFHNKSTTVFTRWNETGSFVDIEVADSCRMGIFYKHNVSKYNDATFTESDRQFVAKWSGPCVNGHPNGIGVLFAAYTSLGNEDNVVSAIAYVGELVNSTISVNGGTLYSSSTADNQSNYRSDYLRTVSKSLCKKTRTDAGAKNFQMNWCQDSTNIPITQINDQAREWFVNVLPSNDPSALAKMFTSFGDFLTSPEFRSAANTLLGIANEQIATSNAYKASQQTATYSERCLGATNSSSQCPNGYKQDEYNKLALAEINAKSFKENVVTQNKTIKTNSDDDRDGEATERAASSQRRSGSDAGSAEDCLVDAVVERELARVGSLSADDISKFEGPYQQQEMVNICPTLKVVAMECTTLKFHSGIEYGEAVPECEVKSSIGRHEIYRPETYVDKLDSGAYFVRMNAYCFEGSALEGASISLAEYKSGKPKITMEYSCKWD